MLYTRRELSTILSAMGLALKYPDLLAMDDDEITSLTNGLLKLITLAALFPTLSL